MNLFFAFYLLGLFVSDGQALLQVTISLSKVEISVGESKFFTCTAIGELEEIDWYNPQGEKIVSTQRVVVQKEGARSRLTIYNANIEDAGIYRCQGTDTKGQTQEATVVLVIYQKLTFKEVVSPQEFKQGEDAEVVCQVSSSPAPIVSWLYHNEDVTTHSNNRFAMLANNNLQILNINKSDEGIYRCEGRVEARGEIDFRDIIVIVNVPPAITMPLIFFNATADRQEEMLLYCRATGSPEPNISWYRNGKLIEDNEKYTLKKNNTELSVRNIINSDGGPYVCKATNIAGKDEKQSFLQVFATRLARSRADVVPLRPGAERRAPGLLLWGKGQRDWAESWRGRILFRHCAPDHVVCGGILRASRKTSSLFPSPPSPPSLPSLSS
ncbi:neural cell adhesion molecule 2-like [Macrotis lagotis]|uniref:neural cell adhesion molecule 2-like n=1 Tax=Macrotis lagotis TaxID=92651 RepID=UPI003D69A4AB